MKNHFILQNRKIAFKGKWDVIVCGAGPAGITAALTSVRSGCRTLLIEKMSFVGGAITAAYVVNWIGAFGKQYFKTQLSTIKLLKRVIPRKTLLKLKSSKNITFSFNQENFKYLALKLLREKGVDVLLDTLITDIIVKKNYIEGIIVENRNGPSAFKASCFIDATGEGDVASLAGVSFKLKKPKNRFPSTLVFRLGGVSAIALKRLNELFNNNYMNKKFKALQRLGVDKVSVFPSARPGVFYINMTKTIFDHLNVQKVPEMQEKLRRQMYDLYNFLRRNIKGFSHSYILDSAPIVGAREGRHIKCLYTLQKKDILSARNDLDFKIPSCHYIEGDGNKSFQFFIPYRSLIASKINNLIVAGRCISVHNTAFLYIRKISTCMSTGETAGILANIYVKNRIPLNKIITKITHI